MTVLRMPEATISFNRGRRVINEPGKATRSRRVTTMSTSARAAASASSSGKWVSKVTTSTSSASGDQSATSVATF